MNLTEIIELLKLNKDALKHKYYLKSMAIFGSFARGDENTDSDIDIMVEIGDEIGIEFINLAEDLERIISRKVDLVSKNGIKPKYFEIIKDDLIYV